MRRPGLGSWRPARIRMRGRQADWRAAPRGSRRPPEGARARLSYRHCATGPGRSNGESWPGRPARQRPRARLWPAFHGWTGPCDSSRAQPGASPDWPGTRLPERHRCGCTPGRVRAGGPRPRPVPLLDPVEILERPPDEQFARGGRSWQWPDGVVQLEDQRLCQGADLGEAEHGALAFDARGAGLPQGCDEPGAKSQRDRQRRRHSDPMTANELAGPVSP